jgi:hypothetical protein
MTEQESNHGCKFYCVDCFAYVESECFCDRIVGHDPETGYPIVNLTEDDEAYLYIGSASQVGDELKLGTDIQTEDTGLKANTTTENTTRNLTHDRISENDIVDKETFYCIDCSKFIEDEVKGYDHPVVCRNNKYRVIFGNDVRRFLELGTSQLGQITRYETAEMYGSYATIVNNSSSCQISLIP